MVLMATNRAKSDNVTYLYQLGKKEQFRKQGEKWFRKVLLREILRQKKSGIERPLVGIYIHGYNTPFRQSVEQLIDLEKAFAAVTEPPPILIGFSWPSAGRRHDYITDREQIKESTPAFNLFLTEISSFLNKNEQNITFFSIAHSLGNYLLRKGLSSFISVRSEPLFDETILLAPDLSSREFEKEGREIARFSKRVHIYYSPKDQPLKIASLFRFGKRRLGRHGVNDYKKLPANVVVIDAGVYANNSAITGIYNREGKQIWVHNSYRYHQVVLEDMLEALQQKPTLRRVSVQGRRNHFLLR